MPSGPARALPRCAPFLIATLACTLVIGAETPPPGEPEGEGPRRSPASAGLGLELSPSPPGADLAAIPERFASPSPGAPCWLLIPAGRADLQEPGRLDAVVRQARERSLRLVVRLVDDGWPSGEAFPADEWIARTYALARRFQDDVDAYQIFERAAARDARSYAYLLKRSAVMLRAASPRARIVLGGLGPEDDRFAADLFALDAAPYIDVVAADGSASLPAARALRDRLLPRAPLWVARVPLDPAAPEAAAARAYFDALSAGASLVLVRPPAPPAPSIG